MQTEIASQFRQDVDIDEAESILRSCVHCGFCTATCPTYQVLGDELDGPRGRIYLIKDFLAGHKTSEETREYLDRCLLCRACETTCPSGVRYGRLVEISRREMDRQLPRPAADRLNRALMRQVFPYPQRLRPLLWLGQSLKDILRDDWARRIPACPGQPGERSSPVPERPRVLLLAGCVQSVSTPNTNAALEAILDHLGISWRIASAAGCCGALSMHLGAEEEALGFMRRNIDAWWPWVEQGAEAILISASGCASMLKDYAQALRHDAQYAAKAERISALARDPGDWLLAAGADWRFSGQTRARVALHNPCSLQHALRLHGQIEGLLRAAGYQLLPVADGHLCCGSAGSYSLLQPQMANELRTRKLRNLQAAEPEVIATANVGCQLHLQQEAAVPVRHWLELLAEAVSQE